MSAQRDVHVHVTSVHMEREAFPGDAETLDEDGGESPRQANSTRKGQGVDQAAAGNGAGSSGSGTDQLTGEVVSREAYDAVVRYAEDLETDLALACVLITRDRSRPAMLGELDCAPVGRE